MATRDVELVIRARDEAAKIVDGVTASVEALAAAQALAAKGAAQTGSATDKLNAQLKNLGNQDAVINALTKVAVQLERAEKYTQSTAAAIPGLITEEARLAAETAKAVVAQEALTSKLNASQAALKSEAAAAAKVQVEYTAAAAAKRKLDSELNALNKAKVPKDTTKEAAQAARKAELSNQIAHEQQTLAAHDAFLKQAAANKKRAMAEEKALRAEKAAADNNVANLSILSGKNERSKGFAEERNTRAIAALADLKAVAATAAAAVGMATVEQNALGAASARTADLIKRTTAALEAEKTVLKAQGAAPAPTPPRQNASTAPRRLADYRAEQEAIRAARDGLSSAREESSFRKADATRLGKELATAAAPTAELAAEFNLAKIEAEKATSAYMAQAAALQRLIAAERERKAIHAQNAAEASRPAAPPPMQADSQVNAYRRNQSASTGAQANAQSAGFASNAAGHAAEQANDHIRFADATIKSNRAIGEMEAAFGKLNGVMKGHASNLQSVTGHVVGLIAAYAGFQSVSAFLEGVVETIRVMDAATNRLGVVFEGNTARTAQEITFLQAQAARLGISFGTLVDQYARVSLATKEAGGTTEETRKIFMAFAETGRVAKLSTSEMQRMFLSLDEMMSRGKIQAKELRQLSYTIAGAPQIIAKSLGMTMAELTKAMKSGEVDASVETMLKIADGLTSRYGAQVPEALQTTTTELGRLSNTLFQMQASFAEGGFSEALRNALRDLNEEMSKPEGAQMMRDLGASAGKLIEILEAILKHWKEIATVLEVIAAFWAGGKIVGGIKMVMGVLGPLRTAIMTLGPVIRSIGVGLEAAGTMAEAAGVAFAGFGRIVAVLIPGLGEFVLAAILAYEVYDKFIKGAQVDPQVNNIAKHKEHMKEFQLAYEAAGKSVDSLKDKLKNVNLGDLEKSFSEMHALFKEKMSDFDIHVTASATAAIDKDASASGNHTLTPEQGMGITSALRDMKDGKKTVAETTAALEELRKTVTSDKGTRFLTEIIADLSKLSEFEDYDKKAATAAEALGSTLEDVGKTAAKYGQHVKDIVAPHDAFAEAIERAKKATEDYDATEKKLDGVLEKSIKNHKDLAAVLEAVADKKRMIADADALLAIAGADKKANDDALAKKSNAEEKGDAAVSARIKKLAGIKDPEADEAAIRAELNKTNPKLAEEYDAALLKKKADDKAAQDKKDAEKKAKDQKTFDLSVSSDITKRQFAGAQSEQIVTAKSELDKAKKTGVGVDDAQANLNALERQAAVEKAMAAELEKAKTKELTIDSKQLQTLGEIAGKEWDAAHAADAEKQATDRLKEAETRLGDLISRRKALQDAIQFNKDNPGLNPPAQQAQLKTELAQVTVEAKAAADEAERLARNLGDKKAIDSIRNTRDELMQLKESWIDVKAVEGDFVNGLSGAFGKMADAIGAGINHTKSWANAWREVRNAFLNFAADFLKQIGEMLVKQALLKMFGMDDKKGGASGGGSMSNPAGILAGGINKLLGGGESKSGDPVASAGGAVAAAAAGGSASPVGAAPASEATGPMGVLNSLLGRNTSSAQQGGAAATSGAAAAAAPAIQEALSGNSRAPSITTGPSSAVQKSMAPGLQAAESALYAAKPGSATPVPTPRPALKSAIPPELNDAIRPSKVTQGVEDLSALSQYRHGDLKGDPQGFVFHHTGGRGDAKGVINTLNERGLGVQYVMGRDGKVYRTLPEGARGAHIKDGWGKGEGLSNSNTEGMEIIAKNDKDLTDAQKASARQFGAQYHKDHPDANFFGHGEVNPGHKEADEGLTVANIVRNDILHPQTAALPPLPPLAEVPPIPAPAIPPAIPPVEGADGAAPAIVPPVLPAIPALPAPALPEIPQPAVPDKPATIPEEQRRELSKGSALAQLPVAPPVKDAKVPGFKDTQAENNKAILDERASREKNNATVAGIGEAANMARTQKSNSVAALEANQQMKAQARAVQQANEQEAQFQQIAGMASGLAGNVMGGGGAAGGLGGLLGGGAAAGGGLGGIFSSLGGTAANLLGGANQTSGMLSAAFKLFPSLFGMLHSGGMASNPSSSRPIDPSVFAGAARMHSGGLVGGGLTANEVPRILEKQEEVLTRSDPRHILNGGKNAGKGAPGQKGMNVKIVNAIDAGDMMQKGLATSHGEEAIMNTMRNNREAIKGMIG